MKAKFIEKKAPTKEELIKERIHERENRPMYVSILGMSDEEFLFGKGSSRQSIEKSKEEENKNGESH